MNDPISTKTCSKCKVEKPISEFPKNKSANDGLQSSCDTCYSEYQKKYYQDNKERLIVNSREYNAKNKDKVAKRCKNYYETNKDQILKQHKEYYQNNKDDILDRCKSYCEQNKEKINKRKRHYYQNNKEIILAYHVLYNRENKEKIYKYAKLYQVRNKQQIEEYNKAYYKNNRDRIVNRVNEWRKNNHEQVKRNTRKSNHQYRSRKRNAIIENFSDTEIFKRDNYICQLCGCKTSLRYKSQYHPKRTELDHIIPLSVGGEHSKRNTQCLCHQCNIEKGNRVAGDQLRLFG